MNASFGYELWGINSPKGKTCGENTRKDMEDGKGKMNGQLDNTESSGAKPKDAESKHRLNTWYIVHVTATAYSKKFTP
jgi:hypothetical protein